MPKKYNLIIYIITSSAIVLALDIHAHYHNMHHFMPIMGLIHTHNTLLSSNLYSRWLWFSLGALIGIYTYQKSCPQIIVKTQTIPSAHITVRNDQQHKAERSMDAIKKLLKMHQNQNSE